MRIVLVTFSVACSLACVMASASALPRIYPGLRHAHDPGVQAQARHVETEHRASDHSSKVGYRRPRER